MTDPIQKIPEFPIQYDQQIVDKPLTLADIQNFPIDFLQIFHLIETVTAVPAGTPTKLYDQVKLYTDSLSTPSVYRIYFYMTGLNAWHYASLT